MSKEKALLSKIYSDPGSVGNFGDLHPLCYMVKKCNKEGMQTR